MSHEIGLAALAIIKGDESCRLIAYPDPGSGGEPWTIGWGATGQGICSGLVWTQEQADARLDEDLSLLATRVIDACSNVYTGANQFGALCSLAYNIGIGNFSHSSVLRFHRSGEHHEAAAAFAAWNKSCGRVLPGLSRRRAAEAALYLKPDTSKGTAT